MPRIGPFERHLPEYEKWFEQNRYAYLSELAAVKSRMSAGDMRIEIGVGSGLFAAPLGIRFGVEPSLRMAALAKERGIHVIRGIGEQLPLGSNRFDLALMVTTVCFLDNVPAAFAEVWRILKNGGHFLIGFVDRNAPIGREYERIKNQSLFYREADFYSVEELIGYLKETGFGSFAFKQTIFRMLPEITSMEPVKDGWGKGSFVVIDAKKEGK